MRQHLEDARVQQELRHWHVSALESCLGSHLGECIEIDVRRDVLQTGPHEWLITRAVPMVAAQRALIALRVVVGGFVEAIVDEHQRARMQPLGKAGDERLLTRVYFAEVAIRPVAAGDALRSACRQSLRGGGRIRPVQFAADCGDAALQNAAVVADQQVHRHGIEDFVAQDDAVQAVGQGIEPFGSVKRTGHRGNRLALPSGQCTTQFDDAVAHVGEAGRSQQLGRKCAVAGTKFGYRARIVW